MTAQEIQTSWPAVVENADAAGDLAGKIGTDIDHLAGIGGRERRAARQFTELSFEQ